MKIGDLVSYKGKTFVTSGGKFFNLQGLIGLIIEESGEFDRVVLVQWNNGDEPRWHRWAKLEVVNENR